MHHQKRLTRAFPWWGWLGVAVTVISWVLAWNRFSWFEPMQPFTFTPLWLGYILIANASTYKWTGHCMMVDRPRYFLWLFPLSAAFWWFFEYLNRFVQNWYYIEIEELTAWQYFLRGTIPFSTVLPAVLGTMECLAAYTGTGLGWEQAPRRRSLNVKGVGWGIIMCASVGLAGIGLWPNHLFPLVWIAPLLLLTSFQMITGSDTIFSEPGRRNWTTLWMAPVAALICGFFWEMWNAKSLSHWEYAIPFVHRFQVFEMPLLGYAGYLPFGLECAAVAQFFFPGTFRESPVNLEPTVPEMKRRITA
jgi:hypothetical protein